jgi:hypothetical protein
MKIIIMKFIYLLLCLGLSNQLGAQSLVDDANLALGGSYGENVFQETIKIISNSKKIFILTNNNQQLGPGDFISLAIGDKLAARAMVAKVHQGQVGIKILKIYSVAQWGRLQRNQEVQIVKGDDTNFGKKATSVQPEQTTARIRSEEDLYSADVVADTDPEIIDEAKARHIRPDNIISVAGAYYEATEIELQGGGRRRTTMFGFSWAYQFTDNFFAEAVYGRANFTNYPADNAQTLVNQLVGRLKFNIKGPLYTFFMPYIGYQHNTVSSPDAGKSTSTTQNEQELATVDLLRKSGPVFGVTILRRLVPGWFVKADLGTDIMNLGFAIEF